MVFSRGLRIELNKKEKKKLLRSVLTQAHSLAGIVSQGQDVLPTGIFSLHVIYLIFSFLVPDG